MYRVNRLARQVYPRVGLLNIHESLAARGVEDQVKS